MNPKTTPIREWIPVTKELPETGKKVLVCGKNNGAKYPYRTCAAYYPKGTLDASCWDDLPEDWWDENDNCVNPEDSWTELSVEGEEMWFLSNITHWMLLPEFPENNEESNPK